MKQLLFEPELLSQVKPDIQMVATLMALKGKIPEKTKVTVRQLVKAVVNEIVKRLSQDLRRAVTGALNRRQHSPLPEVVDLSEQCATDPVDMLFGIQLGGGMDINKSLAYCSSFIAEPKKTLFILVSDLYEGGNRTEMIQRLIDMHQSGVKTICLLALTDQGVPSYDDVVAKKLAQQGIPCFGCSPDKLPELIEGALKGQDLSVLAERVKQGQK